MTLYSLGAEFTWPTDLVATKRVKLIQCVLVFKELFEVCVEITNLKSRFFFAATRQRSSFTVKTTWWRSRLRRVVPSLCVLRDGTRFSSATMTTWCAGYTAPPGALPLWRRSLVTLLCCWIECATYPWGSCWFNPLARCRTGRLRINWTPVYCSGR